MRFFLSTAFALLLLLSAAPGSEAASVCVGPSDEACVTATPDGSVGVAAGGLAVGVSCPLGGTVCTVSVDDQETSVGLTSEQYSGYGCTSTTYRAAQSPDEVLSVGTCGDVTCVHSPSLATTLCNALLSYTPQGTGVCHEYVQRYDGGDHSEWRRGGEICEGVFLDEDGAVCTFDHLDASDGAYAYTTDCHGTDGTKACSTRSEDRRTSWGFEWGSESSTCAGVEQREEPCAGGSGDALYVVYVDTYDNDPNVQQRLACVSH